MIPRTNASENISPRSIVMKFGGTSVGDVERIQRVAGIVAQYREENPDDGIVVVVSAMAGDTNRLTAMARICSTDPDPRELDVLLATGEQVSIALVAMALQERVVRAKSFIAPQARISTNSNHTKAHIHGIEGTRLQEFIATGGIPVVAGFQGVSLESGDITTLGRGGSDITAVAIAATLESHACYIFTDVAGVYSTDPRVCPHAQLLSMVAYEEMLEMASLGAKVLHPRSVYFAMRYQVPLVVLSTFLEGRQLGRNGTFVVSEEKLMEKALVTGITHRLDEAQIAVSEMGCDIASLSLLFEALAEQDIYIDMISQEFIGTGKVNVSLTVPDEQSERALAIIRGIVPKLGANGVGIGRDIAKVSVVGIGMRYHTGVASRVFATLARHGINIKMVNTSEIKISLLVARKYCEIAVRLLHDEFFNAEQD